MRRRATAAAATGLVLAAVVGAASGSTSGGVVGPEAQRQTARQAASYNFKAQFNLRLKILWVTKINPERNPCSPWTVTDGFWRTDVYGYVPGHFSPVPQQRTSDWATFVGVGRLYDPSAGTQSISIRRIGWSGGINWTGCSGRRPAVVQPPDDCDDVGKERRIAGQAMISGGRRVALTTLDEIAGTVAESRGRIKVLVFNAIPDARRWYKKCPLPSGAVELPVNIAFALDDGDIRQLSSLKANESWSTSKASRGDCIDLDQIPESDRCTFTAGVGVTIRRIKPRERFP